MGRHDRGPPRPGDRGVRPRTGSRSRSAPGTRRATPTCAPRRRRLIAYGEKEWTLDGFERVLATGTVDVVGIDPGRAEGITGFKKVTERIEFYRRQANAHCLVVARSCTAASLAISFSSPAFKLFEFKPLRNPMQHDLVTEPFEHVDGWVYPPTGPGLGHRGHRGGRGRLPQREGAGRRLTGRSGHGPRRRIDDDVERGRRPRGQGRHRDRGGRRHRQGGRARRSPTTGRQGHGGRPRPGPGSTRSSAGSRASGHVGGGRRPARPRRPRGARRARARRSSATSTCWPTWPPSCVAAAASTRSPRTTGTSSTTST